MTEGKDREFVELKQQFLDYRDRQMEANVDIKARLSSIDASLSSLVPIITKHEERFNTIEQRFAATDGKLAIGAKRVERLEQGAIGMLMSVAGLFVVGVWQHVFPPIPK